MSIDGSAERFRRRVRWPALVIVGALAVATAIIWAIVLKPPPPVDNSCNEPGIPTSSAAPSSSPGGTAATAAAAQTAAAETAAATTPAVSTTLGAITDRNTLRDTRPASPELVNVQVVNATTTPGLARTVTEQLRKAGFVSIRPADDDPLYPASDLRCYAEIRYGQAGSQAARTLLIVAPCATLVLDDRFDDSVELALGKLYDDKALTEDQQAQLEEIRRAATPPAVFEGATQAVPTAAAIPPLPTAVCPA